jgi:ribosomal protein RSM22 (predicted rRNA methylase)
MLAPTGTLIDTAAVRGDWARLIRNPNKAHQHVLLHLCAPTGTLERVVIGKKKWRHAQVQLYFPYLQYH